MAVDPKRFQQLERWGKGWSLVGGNQHQQEQVADGLKVLGLQRGRAQRRIGWQPAIGGNLR